MLEIFAYQTVLLQMSVYIAQKDAPGGLHWDHALKGIIFLVWALAQRLVPLIFGAVADKFGFKRTILSAFVFVFFGYIALGTQTQFYPFLVGAVLLGIGSGMFKPALQGAFSSTLDDENRSSGWNIYFMLYNLAVLVAIPFSYSVKSIGWKYLFFASAAVTLLNFAATAIFFHSSTSEQQQPDTPGENVFAKFFRPKVCLFVLIMSGFTIIYMQFYETLPNFIYDWLNSGDVVSALKLPSEFLMQTALGSVISYEWLYLINTLMIVALITLVGNLLKKYSSASKLVFGILLATLGLTLCGNSNFGFAFIGGIVIYTLGEMITNPNFTGYLDSIAEPGEKATFLSFLNVSFAIGLGGGSYLGGILYHSFGDKATLASKYILENKNIVVSPIQSLNYMQTKLGMNPLEIRDVLWSRYQPYMMWWIFTAIGLITAFLLFIYKKKYSK